MQSTCSQCISFRGHLNYRLRSQQTSLTSGIAIPSPFAVYYHKVPGQQDPKHPRSEMPFGSLQIFEKMYGAHPTAFASGELHESYSGLWSGNYGKLLNLFRHVYFPAADVRTAVPGSEHHCEVCLR